MKNIKFYNGELKNNSIKKLNAYCKHEQEKRIRLQKVKIITSHLLNIFQITSHNTGLVLILSNRITSNNAEALMIWIDERLDEIGIEDYQQWEITLEIFLTGKSKH